MELGQPVGKVMLHLAGQNAARGDVVAVTKSAGNTEDLELVRQRRTFQQPIDVDPFRLGAGLLECESRFPIAVGSGGSENEGLEGA